MQKLSALIILSIFACASVPQVFPKNLAVAAPMPGSTAVGIAESQNPVDLNPATIANVNDTNPQWMARHLAKLKAIREQPPDLIFIGDSITNDWELDGPEPWKQFKTIWDKYYGSFKAINLGFNGDTTANVLWRLQNGEIDNLQPKAVVLEIGVNNTGHMRWSAQQTVEGIDAVVKLIHEKMPKAKIIVLGILPCKLFNAPINLLVNDTLSKKFRNYDYVTFLDLSGIFEHNGILDTTLFMDGFLTPAKGALHPTSEGQERMAKALNPILLKYLSEPDDQQSSNQRKP